MNSDFTMATYKILLFNVGYASGIQGRSVEYLTKGYRYLYQSDLLAEDVRHQMENLIAQEQPDLCCFLEVHAGSPFVGYIANHYPYFDVRSKYAPQSLLQRTPFHRGKCNAFFAKTDLNFSPDYLQNGNKKLLYEVKLESDTTVFFAHFSLHAATRQKQFAEIAGRTKQSGSSIVCGDFNMFSGVSELNPLLSQSNLSLTSEHQHTFPSHKPRHLLDTFLCTPDIDVRSLRVLDSVRISDHLPVVLEFAI